MISVLIAVLVTARPDSQESAAGIDLSDPIAAFVEGRSFTLSQITQGEATTELPAQRPTVRFWGENHIAWFTRCYQHEGTYEVAPSGELLIDMTPEETVECPLTVVSEADRLVFRAWGIRLLSISGDDLQLSGDGVVLTYSPSLPLGS